MTVFTADIVFDGRKFMSPGSVVVKDGLIEDVVERAYPEARHLGKYMTPGLVDCHTHCGVHPDGTATSESDVNELSSPVTPHLLASDALDPRDGGFKRALEGGVTTLMVLPGSSNVLGGQGCIVRVGQDATAGVLREKACLKTAISKHFYGRQHKAPATKMAVYWMLRQCFMEARDGQGGKTVVGKDGLCLERGGIEALKRVLDREMPMRVHLMTASEILRTLALKEEFGIDVVMDHGTEAHLVADELREKDVPVVYGPLFVPRDGSGRRLRMAKSAAVLLQKGVKVALMTDHPVIPIDALRLEVGLLIAEGIAPDVALSCVTATSASILGLDGKAGRLAPGMKADLVGWNGEPWQPGTRVARVVTA